MASALQTLLTCAKAQESHAMLPDGFSIGYFRLGTRLPLHLLALSRLSASLEVPLFAEEGPPPDCLVGSDQHRGALKAGISFLTTTLPAISLLPDSVSIVI